MAKFSSPELMNWDVDYHTRLKHQRPVGHVRSLSSSARSAAFYSTFQCSTASGSSDIYPGTTTVLPVDHNNHSIYNQSIASSSNLVTKPNLAFSRDGLVTSPVVAITPSVPGETLSRASKPPLGLIGSQYASNSTHETMATLSGNQFMQNATEEAGTDSPPAGDQIASRVTISATSSANTEGEDEADEMHVDTLLRPCDSPSRPSRISSHSPPVSTPSFVPSEPLARLLQPSPDSSVPITRRLRPRISRKLKFSWVALPPFPPGLGRRDYKKISLPKSKGSSPLGRVHTSVSDALSSAWQHNASIGNHYNFVHNSIYGSGSPNHESSSQTRIKNPRRDEENHSTAAKKRKLNSDHPRADARVLACQLQPPPSSTFDIPAHPVSQLSLDVMDPLDPPPSSYPALVSATRHLRPRGQVPPLASANIRAQLRTGECKTLFPSRDSLAPLENEITLGALVRETQTPSDGIPSAESLGPTLPPSSVKDSSSISRKGKQAKKVVDDADQYSSASARTTSSLNRARVILSSSSSTTHRCNKHIKSSSNVTASAKAVGKGRPVDKDELGAMPLPSLSRSASVDLASINMDVDTTMDQCFIDFDHNDANSTLDTFDSKEITDKSVALATAADSPTFAHRTDHHSDMMDEALYIQANPALDNRYDDLDSYLNYDGGDIVDNTGENGFYGDSVIKPWLLNQDDSHSEFSTNGTGNIAGGYIGNGTIDPSLLGGSVSEIANRSPSPSPAPSSFLRGDNSLELPAKSGSSESPNRPSRKPRKSPGQSPPPVRLRELPQRSLRPPVKADMVLTTDLNLSSQSDSDDTSETSDFSSPIAGRKTARSKRGSTDMCHAPARTNKRDLPVKVNSDKPHRRSSLISQSCHHCRTSNDKNKMTCSVESCRKRFCDMCIGKRYPHITFDKLLTTFVCPVCNNNCRCTVCTRKRGEVYVGTRPRQPRPAKSTKDDHPKTRTNAKKKHSGAAAARVKTVVSKPPMEMNTAWGAIYSLTGENIGMGFLGDGSNEKREVVTARVTKAAKLGGGARRRRRSGCEDDRTENWETSEEFTGEKPGTGYVGDDESEGHPNSVVAARLAQKPANTTKTTTATITIKKKPKQKRVFVGIPQEWWGIRRVRDLDPPVPPTSRCGRKESLIYLPRLRTFVGKKPPRWVYPSPGGSLSERSSSPLTSVPDTDDDNNNNDDDDEQGDGADAGVGWSDEAAGVISLGEDDVHRAILAALSSLYEDNGVEIGGTYNSPNLM